MMFRNGTGVVQDNKKYRPPTPHPTPLAADSTQHHGTLIFTNWQSFRLVEESRYAAGARDILTNLQVMGVCNCSRSWKGQCAEFSGHSVICAYGSDPWRFLAAVNDVGWMQLRKWRRLRSGRYKGGRGDE